MYLWVDPVLVYAGVDDVVLTDSGAELTRSFEYQELLDVRAAMSIVTVNRSSNCFVDIFPSQ